MDQTIKKKMKNNILLDYFYRFVCNFTIADGMFVLYLGQKGLTLAQIGLMEAIFHAVSVMTEIPSGAMSDLFGRKKTLFLSGICGILNCAIMLSTDNLWLLGLSFVFSAWSYNLISGTEEALLYDSMLQLGEERAFTKTAGRLCFVAEIAGGIGLLLGGYVAKRSYFLCYVIAMLSEMASILFVCFMTEPENRQKAVSVKAHFITSYCIVRGDKELAKILVGYALVFACYTTAFLYSQKFYYAKGLDEVAIGYLLLFMSFCSSAGALLAEPAKKRFGRLTSYLLAAVLLVGLCVMAAGSFWISVFGYAAASMANAALYPLQSEAINSRIPSEQRATLISVSSMCFSVVMIVIFPLVGLLAS